ncbi:unnamed protein product [Cuscuta europaea]|uniref:Uncharacterized protein n=1 Tax=Cuscuta europaea TaxID=41803 RepID=A0A9P0Z0Y4_CUSEU|nr:unnamed protein product [Cuscuta europaea]
MRDIPQSIWSTKVPEVVALPRDLILYLGFFLLLFCCSSILTLVYLRCFSGPDMDAKNLAKVKRQLAKEGKKNEAPDQQRAVDEIFPKAGTGNDGGPLVNAVVGQDVGFAAEVSPVGELQRKRAGKSVVPPEGKKQKKGATEKKEAPVVIVEEHSSSEPPAPVAGASWHQDNVQFSITKGTAIMHGTLNPREFLRGATPRQTSRCYPGMLTMPSAPRSSRPRLRHALGLASSSRGWSNRNFRRHKLMKL